MITDALEVFGDHQQIDSVFRISMTAGDQGDHLRFDHLEQPVNNIIIGHNSSCSLKILMDKGFHAVSHHFDGGFRHFSNVSSTIRGFQMGFADDFCNISSLVANALHVCDHFQGRGDLTQIPSYRLLLEKQLQTQGFNHFFLLINFIIQRDGLFR